MNIVKKLILIALFGALNSINAGELKVYNNSGERIKATLGRRALGATYWDKNAYIDNGSSYGFSTITDDIVGLRTRYENSQEITEKTGFTVPYTQKWKVNVTSGSSGPTIGNPKKQ